MTDINLDGDKAPRNEYLTWNEDNGVSPVYPVVRCNILHICDAGSIIFYEQFLDIDAVDKASEWFRWER